MLLLISPEINEKETVQTTFYTCNRMNHLLSKTKT